MNKLLRFRPRFDFLSLSRHSTATTPTYSAGLLSGMSVEKQ